MPTITRDESTDYLGRRLYEKMEELDPSPEPVNWDTLTDREREYHVQLALAVVEEWHAYA